MKLPLLADETVKKSDFNHGSVDPLRQRPAPVSGLIKLKQLATFITIRRSFVTLMNSVSVRSVDQFEAFVDILRQER